MTDRTEIEKILRHTLGDYRVSRGEKRVLESVLTEMGADQQKLALIRHYVFEIARSEVAGPESHAVLGWLEDMVKVLQPIEQPDPQASEAYFSPGDTCVGAIRGLLRRTRRQADICVFTITDNRIAEAIAEAHQRRVKVRILTDNDKAEDLGSDVATLQRQGIAVRVDRTSSHMHHKFAIFDRATLLTGSYNWTRSAAEHNQENIVVSHESSLLAQFDKEFERLWEVLA